MTETTIIPVNSPDYKTWVYNRIDGEMVSQIVTGPKAKELYNDGWRMSPAEFSKDEKLREDPAFQVIADDMAVLMNTLLNIDEINDKPTLMEFAEKFLQLKIAPACKIETIKKRINTRAIELGLYD